MKLSCMEIINSMEELEKVEPVLKNNKSTDTILDIIFFKAFGFGVELKWVKELRKIVLDLMVIEEDNNYCKLISK